MSAFVPLYLDVDYGLSSSKHAVIGYFITLYSLFTFASDRLSLPGMLFFCLGRQISGWSVKPGVWLTKLDPEPLNVKSCDVLWASVASCSRVCLVCVSTAALVWLWEGTETCCDLIAGLITPFHWRLCLFSRHPKLFPPVVLSHIACCLLYTHRIWVSGVEDSCFDCVKLCDKFSFAAVWMWGTGFVTVSKIPLVHSCTGSRNSFPVIQDTRSHYSGHHAFGISVWETLRRGSAQSFRASEQ